LLGGCREQNTAPIDRNREPETFLTRAPGDSQTTFYRVNMRWAGTDYDGAVTAFDVAVTESLPDVQTIQWKRTRRSDSLVTFPVEEIREVLGHRFYVRSVDNEGKVDATPAWVFFGARDNLPPVITFDVAEAFGPGGEVIRLRSTNPDQPTDTIPTGWGVRFRWHGRDDDVALNLDGTVDSVGHVARYLYRLLPIESQFLGETLADTAATYPPTFFTRFLHGAAYAFNVRAVDDAGLSGSGSQTRSFVWNRDPVTKFTRCLRDQGGDSVSCFDLDGTVHYEGDTLPLPTNPNLPFPSPTFRAAGYDPDPLGTTDQTVLSREWRYTSGVVLPQWRAFQPGEVLQVSTLPTGDYTVMARSTDFLDRVEGTPDSLRFYINFSPRFVTTVDTTFVQFPRPGERIPLSSLADGKLHARFYIVDPDASANEKMRVRYRFDSENEAFYRGDFLKPAGEPAEIEIVLETGAFQARSYLLRMRVEDNGQQGGSDRGQRTTFRVIPFTVVAD
jgi:hypothetical protein